MADMEVFLQEIRREVPKADDDTMQDAVMRAARMFCQKSWYVRRQADFTCAVPGIPQNVSIAAGNAQATLAWTPVPNATSYTINVGTVSGQESPNLTNINQTAAVVLNLTNGTEYFFTVQAVNGVGPSAASSEVSTTPQSFQANVPANGEPTIPVFSQFLGLSSDEEIIGVRRAACGPFPLAPASPADMDPKFGSGRPRGFSYAPIGNFMLYPFPNGPYQILLMIAVQPKLGAVQIPDEIAANYLTDIGFGALWLLYKQIGTPWFNGDASLANKSLFDDGLQRAKAEALRDFQSGNLRVQPAPFIIKSIN
jgi:hypothetical protein